MWQADPSFTWADLRTAVHGLPGEGTALARAVHGARAQWTTDRYLLAMVVDYLGELTFITTSANVDKATQRRLKRPNPVERPADSERIVRRDHNVLSMQEGRERRDDRQASREPVRRAQGGPREQSDHASILAFFGKARAPDGESKDVSRALGVRRLSSMAEVRPEFR